MAFTHSYADHIIYTTENWHTLEIESILLLSEIDTLPWSKKIFKFDFQKLPDLSNFTTSWEHYFAIVEKILEFDILKTLQIYLMLLLADNLADFSTVEEIF